MKKIFFSLLCLSATGLYATVPDQTGIEDEQKGKENKEHSSREVIGITIVTNNQESDPVYTYYLWPGSSSPIEYYTVGIQVNNSSNSSPNSMTGSFTEFPSSSK
ncbi:MAG: hypothetical protein AB7R69_03890 [Candidatus Babeliales bacterium]